MAKRKKPVTKKAVTIKKRVKRDSLPNFNMNHPDIKDAIEYAFTAGGKDFFRFKQEVEIPTGRYVHVDAFMREHEMRMSLDVLQGYIAAMRQELGGSKGEINLNSAIVILYKMETRTKMAFDPETIRRLASVIYFDKTESLKGYDSEYGQKKIDLWLKHNTMDFFLTRPISELLGLQNTSPESLQSYIQEATEILRDLTSTPSTPSVASS